MEFLKKNYKHIIGVLIILILMELAVSYYLITQFHANYIGRDEAISRFLAEENLSQEDVSDIKVKLAHRDGDAWYEIEYSQNGTIHQTTVDAKKEDDK